MPASTPARIPYGVLLALVLGSYACRAAEGDRCACADDCRDGLLCVVEGRVLDPGECTPVVGNAAAGGQCVGRDNAAEDDDGAGPPEFFMDLGSRRDFDPGQPPLTETETETETGMSSGTASGSTGSGTSSGGSSSGSGSGSSGSSSSGPS